MIIYKKYNQWLLYNKNRKTTREEKQEAVIGFVNLKRNQENSLTPYTIPFIIKGEINNVKMG